MSKVILLCPNSKVINVIHPTFPSTSSFMTTAGGSSSSFPFGILKNYSLESLLGEYAIYLLVATTLLMKSAILMASTVVVSFPALASK